MKKLTYKKAIKKLLKGKTLFHESVNGYAKVKMKNGCLKCVDTKQEWSFSDFNHFYEKEN